MAAALKQYRTLLRFHHHLTGNNIYSFDPNPVVNLCLAVVIMPWTHFDPSPCDGFLPELLQLTRGVHIEFICLRVYCFGSWAHCGELELDLFFVQMDLKAEFILQISLEKGGASAASLCQTEKRWQSLLETCFSQLQGFGSWAPNCHVFRQTNLLLCRTCLLFHSQLTPTKISRLFFFFTTTWIKY